MGATGRPTLTSLLKKANGEPSVVDEKPTWAAPTRAAQRELLNELLLARLRRMTPPPLAHSWTLYHDKYSAPAARSASPYRRQPTLMLSNINSIKPFWELFNNFPLSALACRDAVHFFKSRIPPRWEASDNIRGGSLTFRVPRGQASHEFWIEVLLLAVGEQFDPLHDDEINGLSFSVRPLSCLISIWNRDGANHVSVDSILAVVQEKLSPNLKPRAGSWYYRRHCEHDAFAAVVAKDG